MGYFSLRHSIQTCSEALPVPYVMGTGGWYLGGTTHLYLMPSLSMRGAANPHPKYVYLACLIKQRDNLPNFLLQYSTVHDTKYVLQ